MPFDTAPEDDRYGTKALAARYPELLISRTAPIGSVKPVYDGRGGGKPAKADWQFRWNRENDQ